MDKDEQIKKLQKEVEDKNKALEEKDSTITQLGKDIEDKDKIIKEKTKDVVGARKEYKKLVDMTEEEKENLSEKEKELIQRQEEIEEREAKDAEERAEKEQKEKEARINKAIKEYAGDDDKLAQKVRENFDGFKDSDTAITEEEIAGVVGKAWNALGDEKPDAVSTAINNNNGEAPDLKDQKEVGHFADSERGKQLSNNLGLPEEEEKKEE